MADLPPVRIAHNLRLLANHDLGGAPNAGEGIAMKITPDGRRILYVAHENPPMAYSILDVTEPTNPELLWQLPVPHNAVRGNSLALRGDILLTAPKALFRAAQSFFLSFSSRASRQVRAPYCRQMLFTRSASSSIPASIPSTGWMIFPSTRSGRSCTSSRSTRSWSRKRLRSTDSWISM